MAFLTNQKYASPVYLKAFHQFGRLFSSVDTTIALPDVSRIHAVIEYQKHWYIRDLSKNGLRVNGKLIKANHPHLLHLNDQISFSSAQCAPFIIENLEPPKDILLPTSQECGYYNGAKPIYLEHYHFLPDESSPELVIFYDQESQQWQCEHFENSVQSILHDGEQLKFSNQTWKLFKCEPPENMDTLCLTAQDKSDLCYIFNISQDEELTELMIQSANQSIDCQTRSHHYLTAILARYKAEDIKQNVPEPLQGWRSIEQLTKDLGLAETHINIQIHRARKQLSELQKTTGIMVPDLIERKRGRIRLAVNDYQIIKGSHLEIDTRGLAA